MVEKIASGHNIKLWSDAIFTPGKFHFKKFCFLLSIEIYRVLNGKKARIC